MDEDRRKAYETLERLAGPEGARAVMSQFPPFPWEDLATKADLADLETRLTGRVGALDERLTGRVDALDGRLSARDEKLIARMDALDEKLTSRMDALDEKLIGRMDALDERLTGRIEALDDKISGQVATLQAAALTNRTMVMSMVGAVTAIGALAVALAGLG